MTRDDSLDQQDGPVADFFAEVRATFVAAPDPEVERRHLAAMVEAFTEASVVPGPAQRRSFMNRVFATRAAKAFAVGLAALLATGSALAATGSLPDDAQDAVANTVDAVGLDIPGGDDELEGAESEEQDEADESEDGDTAEGDEHGTARSTSGCAEGFSGNHGEFVSGSETGVRRDEAAHSDCGKPQSAVENSQSGMHEPDGDDGEDQPAEQGRFAEHRPGDDPSQGHNQSSEHRPDGQGGEGSE